MQGRQIWILNIVLLVAAAFLGWRLTTAWKSGNDRYAGPARASGSAASVYNLGAPEQSTQSPGADVAARNVFSPDRNSDLAKALSSARPPNLPVVFGTMQLGPGREALMSESGAAARGFRRVKTGEQMSGYTVVEIADEHVVVEYQGQKTTINIYQSAKSVGRAEGTSLPMAASPPAAPVVDAVQATPAAAPIPQPAATGSPQQSPATAQQPGVRVTIEGNRRRFEKDSAFGPQVWYEEIQ